MNIERILARDNALLLQQGLRLLEGMAQELYVKPEPAIVGSSIGGHLRHILDHYASLFVKGDEVDYDLRAREESIECSLEKGIERLRQIVGRLEGLVVDGPLDRKIKVDTGHQAWTASSLARELQFVASHTVHHYALIGVILRLNGVTVPEDFGVAPSTLRYREEVESCAR